MRPWLLAPLTALVVAGCGLVVGTDDTGRAASTTTTTAAATTTTRPTRLTVVTSVASTPDNTVAVLPVVLASGPFSPGWRDAGPFTGGANDRTTSTVPSWCGRTPGPPAPVSTATTAWRQGDAGPPTMLVRAERYASGGGAARFAAVTSVPLPCTWTDADGNRLTADAIPGPSTGGAQAYVRITDRGTNAFRLVAVLQQGDDVLILAVDGTEAARMEATLQGIAPRLRSRG